MLYRILILISLMLTQATWAFNDIKINGDDNIYHGGEGDIHLTKIQGIPPAQFTQLAMQLGVTQSALQSFFKILEQQQVAAEDLDATLRRIASHYKQLKTKLAGLSSDDEQVNALRQQADTALEQGEFAQAEKLFNQAHDLDRAVASKALSVLQEMQAVYEKRQLSAADNKASNGDLMMTQLDYAAAADYYQQALRLIEELQANLPKDFAQKWDSYAFDAAFALDDAGDYRPAIVLLEKLLPLREQRLGKNHADVATTLNNLAGLYKAMGAYEKALPLYRDVAK
ncbi:tetratricopeptide repeat protein [Candidatus Venteria ishoeyi]|uniref:Tetratricopeptide repeat protein n=1 Tax=Candidatus Venteria ishoeyi TaxID=1899563 RepID=A0A1H6F458_9GAMM|nr:tetratricopeptide repeat protein [Candidatus Venteria ishoeyi]SEH04171.1 Tetratricopeptide repeat protein [Candidatus Venteria ishoeyi]